MILEIQYLNYLKENPHSDLTFNEWYFNVWTDWKTNTSDCISDWDNTLMDGLEDEDDFEYVRIKMENEGFHYCFKHYSEFKEIKDKKFHELRLAYLEAADALEKYIHSRLYY
jgi:hypothetical protein